MTAATLTQNLSDVELVGRVQNPRPLPYRCLQIGPARKHTCVKGNGVVSEGHHVEVERLQLLVMMADHLIVEAES